MWADGIEAYNAIEIGRSTEVVDKARSKVFRCVVDPILFTVGVDATLLLARFDISGSQFSVELPPSLLSRVTLFRK